MLTDLYDTPTTRVWHHTGYMHQRSRLILSPNGPQKLIDMEAEILARMTHINTASVPTIFGHDWSIPPNTMFQPIYEDIAHQSWNAARLFAGLLLCDMMIRDEAVWYWVDTPTHEEHTRKVYIRKKLLNLKGTPNEIHNRDPRPDSLDHSGLG